MMLTDMILLPVMLLPGKKIKGYAVWEVNTGWSDFEVSYDDDVWSNKTTACFKISSGDIK